jgi:hypothetical protein
VLWHRLLGRHAGSPSPRRPTSTGRFHRRSLTPRQTMVHEMHLESLGFGAPSDSVAPNDTVAARVAQRATCKIIRTDSARPVFEPEAALSLRLPECRAAAAGATVSPSQQVAHVCSSHANLSCCAGKRAVCRCDLTPQ